MQELLGAYDQQAASNYFYDGKALYNTYNDTYRLDVSSFDAFHRYSVEWTDKLLSFSIDGQTRKTWHVGDIPPGSWPQTPMHVKVGVWSVSKDSDGGEVMWAGGVPDWDRGPFRAYFKSLEIEDYMGRCTKAQGPVEYQYDERTWGWQHVQVRGCEKRPGADLPPPSGTASAEPGRTQSVADEPSPSRAGGEGEEEDGAAMLGLSSPLAVLVCLCWLLMIWPEFV